MRLHDVNKAFKAIQEKLEEMPREVLAFKGGVEFIFEECTVRLYCYNLGDTHRVGEDEYRRAFVVFEQENWISNYTPPVKTPQVSIEMEDLSTVRMNVCFDCKVLDVARGDALKHAMQIMWKYEINGALDDKFTPFGELHEWKLYED